MKAPSYQELLSIQSSIENDMIRNKYPEWYALPIEQRITRDGITFEQRQIKAEFQLWEIVIIVIAITGIIGCGITFIFYLID